jgi:hypothetical protein
MLLFYEIRKMVEDSLSSAVYSGKNSERFHITTKEDADKLTRKIFLKMGFITPNYIE